MVPCPSTLSAPLPRRAHRSRATKAALVAASLGLAAGLAIHRLPGDVAGSRALGARASHSAALPVPQAADGTGDATANHSPLSYGGWGSGYVADAPQGSTFTALQTRFVSPTAPARGHPGWVAIWGGIGLSAPPGYELMQDGVSLESTTVGTWAAALTWWINEPRFPTEPKVMGVPVAPGNIVQVNLERISASRWDFRVTNETSKLSADGTCSPCQSVAHTAAWVVEDPLSGSGGGQTGYSDPAKVEFLSASAALDGGRLRALSQLDWHPLLRETVDGTKDGPVGGQGPGANGGFTVGTLS